MVLRGYSYWLLPRGETRENVGASVLIHVPDTFPASSVTGNKLLLYTARVGAIYYIREARPD